MGFERWSALAGQHRRTMILVAMLTTFAGVALLIDRPKGTVLEWFALPLTALGGAIFAWAVGPRFALPQEASPSLASHLLRHLTFHGRLVRWFPAIGVGIILADFMYNLLLSATPSLQTEDTIVLLAAATLRSEEHTSELQSRFDLVCRLLLEKKNKRKNHDTCHH